MSSPSFVHQFSSGETSTLVLDTKITRNWETTKKWQETQTLFVILFIVVILAYVAFEFVAMVYIRYGKFIQQVDKSRSAGAQWPPSGYATALAVEYPFTAKWVGFQSSSVAVAALLSFDTPPYSAIFLPHADEYLTLMWRYAQEGNNDPNAQETQNATTIICSSWGAQAGLGTCLLPCTSPNVALEVVGGASSALSFGMMGAFIPHIAGAGGGVGIAIGAVIGIGIGIAISVGKNALQKKDQGACVPVNEVVLGFSTVDSSRDAMKFCMSAVEDR